MVNALRAAGGRGYPFIGTECLIRSGTFRHFKFLLRIFNWIEFANWNMRFTNPVTNSIYSSL